jgi:hypothetical protein
MMNLIIPAMIASFVLCSLVQGKPIVVSPKDDLAKVFESASDGDVFHLEDGVYASTNRINIHKSITVLAKNPGRATISGRRLKGPEIMLIDTSNATSKATSRVVLDGIVITEGSHAGYPAQSGAIFIYNATVDINNGEIHGNKANIDWIPTGAIMFTGGDNALTITDTNIYDNTGSVGGIEHDDGYGNLTLIRCNIYNNRGEFGAAMQLGGAYSITNLTATRIYSNVGTNTGGVFYDDEAVGAKFTTDSKTAIYGNNPWDCYGLFPVPKACHNATW